ncbi:uncharacterized protein LOC119672764 [Teleopsis dalmanni]|uniref:uncharacterized protein LOC119672764 n=1 Tax=Teleopsis dalmanni TaxID=139649 RepID=UPI0018CD1813|nr:uncharacterized protein LOC119672764 [Teleopsis dalmanni]
MDSTGIDNNINKQNFQGKDCFSRMNFLYQASMLTAGKHNTLSSYYGQLCRNISKKTTLHMDPEIKRRFCKRCSLIQNPGSTADLSISTREAGTFGKKNSNLLDDGIQMNIKCHQCGNQRYFSINTQHSFWLENNESVHEVISMKKSNKHKSKKKKKVGSNVGTNDEIKKDIKMNK